MYLLNTGTSINAEGLLLGALSATGAVVFAWAKKRKEGLDQPTLFYALLPVPLFAVASWFACAVFGSERFPLKAFDFIALQFIALGLGIAHVIFFYRAVGGWRALDWPVRSRDWSWRHFGFTGLLVLAAMVGIMVACLFDFTGVEKGWNYFPALFTFLVPFIWVKAFDSYLDIPVAVYRPWFPVMDYFTYEPAKEFPKATVRLVFDAETSGRFEDVPFDPNKPVEVVYRWVLHTYLQEEPDTYYTEREGTTYVWGWHFHRQRTSWFRWNRRIDPAKSFKKSRLRAGDTIIALREPEPEPLVTVRQEMIQREADNSAQA